MNNIKNFLNNRRNIGIFLALLILILMTVSIRIFLDRRCDTLISDYFDDSKLIKFKNSEKYGYMDANGKIEIEPNYTFATDFHFGYAIVSNENYSYKIIDEDGKIKQSISSYYDEDPCFYEDYGIWKIGNTLLSATLKTIYEENVNLEYIGEGYFSFQDNENKKSGIIDKAGKVTFSWDKDYITVELSPSSIFLEKYAIISDFEDTEEIIDLNNGKVVYTLEDTNNKYMREEENNIFRIINRSENYKTEKWFYVKDDKIVYTLEENIYNLELVNPEDEILKIDYGENEDKKVIYYNYKNKKEIDEESLTFYSDIEKIMLNEYNLKIEKNDDTYTLKKKNKTLLSDCKKIEFLDSDLYEYLYYKTKKNLVLFEKDGKAGIYDIKHDEVVNIFDTKTIKMSDTSTFLIATNYDNNGYNKKNYTIYNLITSKEIDIPISSEIELHTNYIIVKTDDNITYYNTSLEALN